MGMKVFTKQEGVVGLFFQIVICSILVLCWSAVGLCGLTETIEIEVTGGEFNEYVGYETLYLDIPSELQPGETYNWALPIGSGELYDGGLQIVAQDNQDITLAFIDELELTVMEDPTVTLGFAVTAGQYTTSFSFSSPVLSFPTITNPVADAGGSVSLGEDDIIVGAYSGKIFKTLYNADAAGAGGTTFANIVADPPGWEVVGPQTISADVSSIHIKSQFILGGGGIASGGSSFTVIPEPATVCLLGLGGLLLRRKRNK